MSDETGTRAVVLGGSIAGLFAARVLSEAYDEVQIVDRDVLVGREDAAQALPANPPGQRHPRSRCAGHGGALPRDRRRAGRGRRLPGRPVRHLPLVCAGQPAQAAARRTADPRRAPADAGVPHPGAGAAAPQRGVRRGARHPRPHHDRGQEPDHRRPGAGPRQEDRQGHRRGPGGRRDRPRLADSGLAGAARLREAGGGAQEGRPSLHHAALQAAPWRRPLRERRCHQPDPVPGAASGPRLLQDRPATCWR